MVSMPDFMSTECADVWELTGLKDLIDDNQLYGTKIYGYQMVKKLRAFSL